MREFLDKQGLSYLWGKIKQIASEGDSAYVPTLNTAPTSSTTSYTKNEQTVDFEIGQFCRVPKTGGYDFYQLYDLSEEGEPAETVATWVKVEDNTEEIEKKANKDGYYETLGAGVASNLRGSNTVAAQLTYRPSGGAVDVADGSAFVEGIKGKTVKWNQMAPDITTNITGNYEGLSDKRWIVGSRKAWAVTNSMVAVKSASNIYYNKYFEQINSDIIQGNVYYISLRLSVSAYTYFRYTLGYRFTDNKNISKQLTKYSIVLTAGTSDKKLGIWFGNNRGTNHGSYIVKDFVAVDLTQLFGSGNEPSTAADFESWVEENFGDWECFEQNNGSLESVKTSGLKTLGFNQYNPTTGLIKCVRNKQYQITGTYTDLYFTFDNNIVTFNSYTYGETVELAQYYTYGGKKYLSVDYIDAYNTEELYSVNDYCVKESQIYKCTTEISEAEEWNAEHWTLVPDFAAMVTEGIFQPMSITPDANGVFTPTERYIHVEGGNGTDTCVHLVHSGIRNGEYEPYKENTKSLPITTMQGRLNGTGELVTIFPDGLKSAGTVYDEIKVENGVTKAIKRIGSVDLGTLNWNKSTTTEGVFSASGATGIKLCTGFGDYSVHMVCYSFRTACLGDVVSSFVEKSLYCSNWQQGVLWAYDSNYNDASTFKAALSGVMLYYELETPLEYVIDGFGMPAGYNVDDFGTEEALPSNEGTVASVAPILDIRYGVNALDTIRRLPQTHVTEGSMENFLAALSLVTGDAWTKTWNSTTNKYDFTLTPSATGVLAIIAEALAQQQSEIDGLRENLKHLGEVKATTIDSENMPMVCGQPLVVVGSTAPTVVPMFKGQFYLNTTTPALYVAKAVTNSVNDWAQV